MRKRHQDEINEIPCIFAFSNEQFRDGMKKLNLNPDKKSDIEKLTTGFIPGMYIEKANHKRFYDMLTRHTEELQTAIKSDTKGNKNGFVFNMFVDELENHEYSYTCDATDAIHACGLTIEDIQKSNILAKALKSAMTTVMKNAG